MYLLMQLRSELRILQMTLSIGTLGTNQIQYMKYIREYILKLQIHQQECMEEQDE